MVAAIVLALGVATWADAVPSECAATGRVARPLSDEARAELERVAHEVIGRSEYRVAFSGVDEDRGVVEIGSTAPNAQMCNELHARYGPYIEVTKSAPVEFYAVR